MASICSKQDNQEPRARIGAFRRELWSTRSGAALQRVVDLLEHFHAELSAQQLKAALRVTDEKPYLVVLEIEDRFNDFVAACLAEILPEDDAQNRSEPVQWRRQR